MTRWLRSLMLLAGAVTICFTAVLYGRIAASQTSIASNFDHFTTGFRLEGSHQFAECASCHVDGMFVGTPMRCVGCHSRASRVGATSKPARHNLTTEQCESCHRATTWIPVVRVDHFEVMGTCFSCHNNNRAMGKPANHVPAPNTCEDCHSVRMWAQ